VTAFGYVRKSRVHDPARTISPETQAEAIRALAKANGEDLPPDRILSDLDVSGRKGRDRRPGWDALLTAVESGEATSVYAYSLSRFARTVPQLLDFFRLCLGHGVPVRMVRDSIDTSSATGRMVLTILAAVAEMEADVASERVRDAFARKAKDDPDWKGPGNLPYGGMPGEDTGLVLGAFEAAQSYDGAARLLNERAVRTRGTASRPSVWHGSTVRGVLRRLDPERFGEEPVRDRRSRGVRAGAGEFNLSRLLVCGACGTVMTPSRDTRTREVRWYCRNARVDKGSHGRGWVSEKLLLPAVEDEAERAVRQLMERRVHVGSEDDEAKATALDAKEARILDLASDGLMTKDEARRRLGELGTARRGLAIRRTILRLTLPPIIVRAEGAEPSPPREVNAYLRRVLDRIVVESMADPARRGPSREPIRLAFDWRDASLRSADDMPA
jgi:DNA invertase Pin-like site-specific DNA recombinase